MNAMDEILERLLQNNFSELKGLTVDATIPLSESLLNELIRASLEESRHITDMRVSVGSENRLDVKMKTSLWFWPLDMRLKLFRSIDLSDPPKLRAFLENNVLLGKLGAALRALPNGITLYQNQVSVDLAMFLPRPEQKRILELIKAAEISTEPGRLILNVKAER